MSAHVFPALIGIGIETERVPYYRTTVLEAWSGKEVRLSRQPVRTRVRLKVNFARDNVNCTVAPWTAYSELALIKFFHATHLGMADTFHIADPDGGADLVVRFASDELPLVQVVQHIWKGTIDLVTVI